MRCWHPIRPMLSGQDIYRTYVLLDWADGPIRATTHRLPQPDAVRRDAGDGEHPRRGDHERPPRTDPTTVRRHRRAREPRHRPAPFEPSILPDGSGHRRGCRDPRLSHALGLRSRLPGVQGVARHCSSAGWTRSHRSTAWQRRCLPEEAGYGAHVGFHRRGRFGCHDHSPRRPPGRRRAPGPRTQASDRSTTG